MGFVKRLISLLGGLILLAGCTNNPPQIRQVWWLPVLSMDRTGKQYKKELILYVHASDEEGAADLAEIRLENPEREILWKIDSNNWSQWETTGETWVGSSRITGDNEDLAEGEYRLILEDRGGRTAEILLFLEGWPGEETAKQQKIIPLGEDLWQIESEYKGWMILNSRNELVTCPVNTPFEPQKIGGEGIYSYILFNRESMWQIRRGPY
jgi:hypothetical protein